MITLDLTELWLEKGFNLHVLVFFVLATARFTRILTVCTGFIMLPHQVNAKICHATSVLKRSTELINYLLSVQLKKNKISHKPLILDVTLA